jgi:hypothetical protein
MEAGQHNADINLRWEIKMPDCIKAARHRNEF